MARNQYGQQQETIVNNVERAAGETGNIFARWLASLNNDSERVSELEDRLDAKRKEWDAKEQATSTRWERTDGDRYLPADECGCVRSSNFLDGDLPGLTRSSLYVTTDKPKRSSYAKKETQTRRNY